MKGIILAGGNGTRLYPLTKSISKQLLPVYDKPMIYYPLSVLMSAGIREILIVSTSKDLPRFKDLLGSGAQLGLQFEYIVQENPEGIAQAFILGEKFIGNDDVCLILGDNIFYGHGLGELLKNSIEMVETEKHGVVFGYYVKDPARYGVVGFDKDRRATSIEEKPISPKSNYAVTGLYFYPSSVVQIASQVKPSARNELEITAVNQAYLEKGELDVHLLGSGYAWLDTGTHESLLDASQFIETLEKRQGLKIACIEELAYRLGYITSEDVIDLAKSMKNNQYGEYLINLIKKE